MPEEEHYVYVATTSVDVPTADKYVLIARLKQSVRVLQHGHETLIRQAFGRQFFFSKEELDAFFVRHVEAKRDTHTRALARCNEGLHRGISVYEMPKGTPVAPKKGWLDD